MLEKHEERCRSEKEIHLGTANFFKKYGSIRSRKVSYSAYREILSKAKRFVKLLDYAEDYGAPDSKRKSELSGFEFATKFNVNSPNLIHGGMRKSIESQLSLFAKDSCSIVYLRGGDELSLVNKKRVTELGNELSELMDKGLIRQVGVSVYDPNEIEFYLNLLPSIETFQVPVSILNQKFVKAFEKERNFRDTTKFVARSIFLQGILIQNLKRRPQRLKDLEQSIDQLNQIAKINGVSQLELCLGFINSIDWISAVAMGVESTYQLEENYQVLKNSRIHREFFKEMNLRVSSQVDPRHW